MGVKVQMNKKARNAVSSNSSGLLLGTRDEQVRILHLVQTPKTPPATSSHRWTVEHANLVRPMCPGGLSILGIYLPLCGKSATPSKDVEAAAAVARDVVAKDSTDQTPLVLCRGSKGRIIVKHVGASPDDRVRTGDLKELPGLELDFIPIRAAVSIPRTVFPLKSAFATPAELKAACYSIADTIARQCIMQLPDELNTVITSADDDRNLSQIIEPIAASNTGQKLSITAKEPVQVRLLTPICIDGNLLEKSTEDVGKAGNGLTTLEGSLHLEAIATVDSLVGELLQALRADLLQSLRTRANLVVEGYLPEADDDNDPPEQWDQPDNVSFPARVVAPADSTALRFLFLTEYLMPEEGVDDDLKNRYLEALSWDKEKLQEFRVEQMEDHANPDEDDALSSSTTIPRDVTSVPPSTNTASNVQAVMQISLLLVFVLGFLAIVIKQLIDLI